jgi:hypothetical protein
MARGFDYQPQSGIVSTELAWTAGRRPFVVNVERQRAISWVLVATGFLGVLLSYYGIWGLLNPFSAGLAWPESLALFVSGPISAAGGVIAYRKPRQQLAVALGVFGFLAWITLWVLCFTKLGFRLDL